MASNINTETIAAGKITYKLLACQLKKLELKKLLTSKSIESLVLRKSVTWLVLFKSCCGKMLKYSLLFSIALSPSIEILTNQEGKTPARPLKSIEISEIAKIPLYGSAYFMSFWPVLFKI